MQPALGVWWGRASSSSPWLDLLCCQGWELVKMPCQKQAHAGLCHQLGAGQHLPASPAASWPLLAAQNEGRNNSCFSGVNKARTWSLSPTFSPNRRKNLRSPPFLAGEGSTPLLHKCGTRMREPVLAAAAGWHKPSVTEGQGSSVTSSSAGCFSVSRCVSTVSLPSR